MQDETMPLNERIEAALKRITTGQAAMRVPVEATDPDIVLADCAAALAKRDAVIRVLTEALNGVPCDCRGMDENCKVCAPIEAALAVITEAKAGREGKG